MDTIGTQSSTCDPQLSACADELLFHTSRYYGYTERFLARLACEPGFCMVGYNAERLSAQQRRLLAGLLTERPDAETVRHIIDIVRDVIAGVGVVDEALLQRHQATAPPERRYFPRHAPEAAAYAGAVAPADPLQNMAARLHIPIQVRGRLVCVPLEILGRHLDSPNPAIRTNLRAAVQRLHEAGYLLVNTPHRPRKKIDWGRRRGLSLRGLAWRLLGRWRPARRDESYMV